LTFFDLNCKRSFFVVFGSIPAGLILRNNGV